MTGHMDKNPHHEGASLRETFSQYLADFCDRHMDRLFMSAEMYVPLSPDSVHLAVQQLYRGLRLRAPLLQICDSPVTAFALRSFFTTISLTYSQCGMRWNALVDPVVEHLVEPVMRWGDALMRWAMSEDLVWGGAHRDWICSQVLHSRPDFLNVWLSLPEQMRSTVWSMLHEALEAVGSRSNEQHVRLLQRFLLDTTAETVAEMRRRYWEATDDSGLERSDLRNMQKTWMKLRVEFRSHLHPGRWKPLWRAIHRKQLRYIQRAIQDQGTDVLCRSTGKAGHFRGQRKAIETVVDQHGRRRVGKDMVLPFLSALEASCPDAADTWDPIDQMAFERMAAQAAVLEALYTESDVQPDIVHAGLQPLFGSGAWVFPHKRICWVCLHPFGEAVTRYREGGEGMPRARN